MPRVVEDISEIDLELVRNASEHLQVLTTKLPDGAIQVLAGEVMQRLSARVQSVEELEKLVQAEEIELLCEALVSREPDAGAIMIAELRRVGTSLTDIYLLHLAAAARRLGEKWTSDELSFVDVTVGTSRILAIMRSLRDAFRTAPLMEEREIIFASVPGEQHTVGITMAAELFGREGWTIDLVVGSSHEEILDRVDESEALVIGLSAHGQKSLEELMRLIVAIRIVKPAAYILVSGNIVDEIVDIASLTGADAFANDIDTALLEVERLHDLMKA